MDSVRETSGWTLLVAAIASIVLLAAVTLATAGPFFNSSEPGCDGSDSTVLMCEDFESTDALHLPPAGPGPGVGSWASENADVANSNGGIDIRTKGWAMRIRDGYPHSICGPGIGFGGTNCVARSILVGGNGGNAALADHNFAPSTGPGAGSEYTEVWMRFYLKRLSPYVFNNNQKFISLNPCCANGGGIVFGGIGDGGNGDVGCPLWDCGLEDNYRNPQNPVNSVKLFQNQGNDIDVRSLLDHWIFVEFHFKLNTYNVRNGLYDVWINDCGVNGNLCTGTPTLRAHYTNIGWSGIGTGGTAPRHDAGLGVFFFDIWGNPADVGTIYFDQIKVSKVGPIGFMPVSGSPPAAPSNLAVR